MNKEIDHSEELFDTLNRNQKKRRRKIIRAAVIIVVLILVVLFTAVGVLRKRVQERFLSMDVEVLSYEVTTGSISTVVSGSGTLLQVDLESLTVPAGVEITEVIAKRNETVRKGDLLATVEMSSVLTAMADLQSQLDDLDDEIADAKGDVVSSTIKAGITGRVKRIFAEPGTDVASCMAQNGALAVLSLDGYMALDLATDQVSAGDAVTVIRAEGKKLEGSVKDHVNGIATIIVTDNGPAYDEEVTVCLGDGTELGRARLYIHSPLAVTGFAGTVNRVSVKENTKVFSNTSLFTLKNTSFSANYDMLLRQRSELEETLLELLTIYRNGAILAPMDGMVSSVDYIEETESVSTSMYMTSEETEETETALLTLYPNISMSVTIGIDEADILALQVGQEAEVEVTSVTEDILTGTVTEISREANTTTGVTQYSAVITLEKIDGMLQGMTAQVDVKIKGVEDALIIPVDALHQTSAISFVYTTYDPETQQYGGMVEVTTGMQNSNYAEVLSGLEEGDVVYYTEAQGFGSFGFGNMGDRNEMGGMNGMSGMGGMNAMPSGAQMPGGFGGESGRPGR